MKLTLIALTITLLLPAACGPPAAAAPAVQETSTEPAGLQIVPLPQDESVSSTESIRYLGELERHKAPSIELLFLIVNRGAEDARIDRLQTTCACSALGLFAGDLRKSRERDAGLAKGEIGQGAPKLTLRPGEYATVRAVLDVNRIPTGIARKYIWAYLPGKSRPALMMRIDLVVLAPYVPGTSRLDFGRVPAGRERTVLFKLFSDRPGHRSGPAPNLVSTNSDVTVSPAKSVVATTRDGKPVMEHHFRVTLARTSGVGPVGGRLALHEGDSAAPHALATLAGEVLGEVRVAPGIVHFGVVSEGANSRMRVSMRLAKSSTLSGLKIAVSDPWLKARVLAQPSGPGAARILEILLTDRTPPGVVDGRVTLRLASGQRLVLPVHATVQPRGSK